MSWLIEDAHVIGTEATSRLANTLKVFVDHAGSTRRQHLRVIITASSDVTAKIIASRTDMRGRMVSLRVPLMERDELERIVTLGATALNVKFADAIIADIVNYSNRQASVCHQLCILVCRAAKIFETQDQPVTLTDVHLAEAVDVYVMSREVEMITNLKTATVDGARGDVVRAILLALATFPFRGGSLEDLHKCLAEKNVRISRDALAVHLRDMAAIGGGELLIYDEEDDAIRIADPMTYALLQWRQRLGRSEADSRRMVHNSSILKQMNESFERRGEYWTSQMDFGPF